MCCNSDFCKVGFTKTLLNLNERSVALAQFYHLTAVMLNSLKIEFKGKKSTNTFSGQNCPLFFLGRGPWKLFKCIRVSLCRKIGNHLINGIRKRKEENKTKHLLISYLYLPMFIPYFAFFLQFIILHISLSSNFFSFFCFYLHLLFPISFRL